MEKTPPKWQVISGACLEWGNAEKYFWRVMEIHHLFPFVEQSRGQSVLCRRAQQRWCLLTFESWPWLVPEKLMSYAVLSSCGCPCLNLVDAVIGHSFFSVPCPSPSQPLLQPVTPHCFSSTVAFLSTLHSHHLVLCLCLRRQREKVSTFTPAIHFTSVCLPENLCSVPTCTCHRVKRAVILELPNS